MATGFQIEDGRDVEELFELGSSAWFSTGLLDYAGNDLGWLLKPYAGAALGFDTGIIAFGGQDLSALFQAKLAAQAVFLSGGLWVGRSADGNLYGYSPSISAPAGSWSETANTTGRVFYAFAHSIVLPEPDPVAVFSMTPDGQIEPGLHEVTFDYTINGTPYTRKATLHPDGYHRFPTPGLPELVTAHDNGWQVMIEARGFPVVLQPGQLYAADLFLYGWLGIERAVGLSDPDSVNGLDIIALTFSPTGTDVYFQLAGNPSQGHFGALTINGLTYPSASAAFTPYTDDGEGNVTPAVWHWVVGNHGIGAPGVYSWGWS